MKKLFVNKDQVKKVNKYSEKQFREYYGDDCIGLMIYENSGECVYEVCVCFNGNKFSYRFDEIGTRSTTYDSLKDFEEDWL